ncbi:MAG: DUF2200 domain-containing protein [Sphaerochaetaceae bacterium]|nr:DUF2200 domain-containing protein [Sphaerochaetaceae bacterium]MDC7238710.1 DUF2200 domain-containing protein [Sphaerochaetaceae bacterium]MDC7249246.1 DUF2200 domain-containing protein [Sphaerochaetaceae bacterium]
MDTHKIFAMSFSKVYPLYLAKIEKKGRSKSELDHIIYWLTGYDEEALNKVINDNIDFKTFFEKAPNLNPNRFLIKGIVCGIRVENIENPLMKEIRYLDKVVDELSKGKSMEKILRKES